MKAKPRQHAVWVEPATKFYAGDAGEVVIDVGLDPLNELLKQGCTVVSTTAFREAAFLCPWLGADDEIPASIWAMFWAAWCTSVEHVWAARLVARQQLKDCMFGLTYGWARRSS